MSGLRAAFLSDMHRWTISTSSDAFPRLERAQNLWKSADLAWPKRLNWSGTHAKSPGVNICEESRR